MLEIEEVVRKLEEALRKRGDSEPPPDLSSLRSLNRSYKAKMAEEQLSSSLGTPVSTPAATPTSQEAPEVSRVRGGGHCCTVDSFIVASNIFFRFQNSQKKNKKS